MKNSLIYLIVVLICGIITTSCQDLGQQDELPLTQEQEVVKYEFEDIPDQYVVVFQDDVVNFRKVEEYDEQQEAFRKSIAPFLKLYKIEELEQVYSGSIHGFAARLDQQQLMSLKQDPQVKYVEQDQRIYLRLPRQPKRERVSTQTIPDGIVRVKGGLRLRGNGLAYILDTGIELDHPDLNVHKRLGFSAYHEPDKNSKNREHLHDYHGHGTHVSGIIAAIDNTIGVVGVAAGATVVPVKVLGDDGWGTWSGVIAGVDYVGHNGRRGDVANMSLGGGRFQAVDDAVVRASNVRGVWFVLAAGNNYENGMNFSPGRANGPFVLTVAAVDRLDRFAWFSNYGRPPVAYAAPGVSVLSTYRNGSYAYLSGTSMAAPHIAGLKLLGEIEDDGFALNPPDRHQYPIGVRAFSNKYK
jgi:hypothetical protein